MYGEIIVNDYIINNRFKIIVKPNSKKTEIIGYDKDKKAIKLSVSASADKNKANIEVVKFFSRLLKKKVIIVSGLKNKEKIMKQVI